MGECDGIDKIPWAKSVWGLPFLLLLPAGMPTTPCSQKTDCPSQTIAFAGDLNASRISQIAEILGIRVEDILRLENKIAFHNYSGSQPHNFGQLQYYNHDEALAALKTLYENRISRLEDEAQEMRKLMFDLIKKKV